MTESAVGGPPDPVSAADPAEFVARLRELRQWAGEPPLRRLRQLAGPVGDGSVVDALPVSTVSHMLRRDRLPRMELVRSYVIACLRARRRSDAEIAQELERWYAGWLRLHQGAARRPADPEPPAGSSAAAGAAPVPTAGVTGDLRTGTVPRQLPADPAGFVGRHEHLRALDALIGRDPGWGPAAVPVMAITGPAGVGKTSLAVHWAHAVAGRFPDGQLYVNLRGFAPEPPMTAAQALGGFLRALGVAGEYIPADLDEQAAMYRSLLADRRMLVVLDNAAAAEQVRPLLAGSPSCGVIVTSRHRLDGLVVREGAHRIDLDVMTPPEAEALLGGLLGERRAGVDHAGVSELARLCGYLPLALRIAAANLISRPHVAVPSYVAELARGDRLAGLRVDGDDYTAVRATFDLSYQRLPARARRLFRLLAVLPGPELARPAAAAVAAEPDASRLLDVVCAAHLLQDAGPDRYRFHDLLRAYAAERAAVEEAPAERAAAVSRVVTWYLHTADAAGSTLNPHRQRLVVDSPAPGWPPVTFADREEALAWCEAERSNLVTTVRRAAEEGLHAVAWKLPLALWDYFYLSKYSADSVAVCQVGLDAARRAGDRAGEAWMLTGLGHGYWELRRHEEALAATTRALRLWREIGDRWGEGAALHLLGGAYKGLRRFAESIDHYRRAMAVHREIDNRWALGWTLTGLGAAYREMHRLEDALDAAGQARAVWRDLGDRHGEGVNLNNLGDVYRKLGHVEDAIALTKEALELNREIGNRWGEAWSLNSLGKILHSGGQRADARECWHEALGIFERLGDPRAAEVRAHLRRS
jgi:tetratricopeptide (TPR) repeat protein